MLELTTVGVLLAGAHVGAVYLGTDVLRLEYSQMLTLNIFFGIIMSLLLKASMPTWKPKLEAAMQQEARQGDALMDVGLMFLVFIAGSIGSAALLYRRYGPVGWLGVVGASALVSWLV